MVKPSQHVTAMLSYSGDKSKFSTWKDKVKGHLVALSDALVVNELQQNRRKPVGRYENHLRGKPVLEALRDGATDKELIDHSLQEAFINQQSSYIKDLFNLTLPSGFADERLMQQPVHEIWSAVEKRYGLNTASGVVELVQRFEAIAASDFKSIAHLFQQLKAARDQVNRNSADALEIGLISQQLTLIKILAVLPGHLWGSGISFSKDEFTLDKVESKLCAIFGSKSKAQIMALGSGAPVNHVEAKAAKPGKLSGTALGKRKARPDPERDMHYNVGVRSCYYCGGVHNDISGGPHFKNACAKRKHDLQLNVKRRDIWSYPRKEKKARADHGPVQKMKGKGKGKFKTKGRESEIVPTEACLPTNVAVDACNAELPPADDAPPSPSPSASPPSGMQLPLTPGGDQAMFDAQESDEPMDSMFNVGVNGGRVDDAQGKEEAALPGEQQAAAEISLQKMRLEDTDAVSD